MLYTFFLIFIGGGAGSVARYAMMNWISGHTGGGSFPWHTLSVNILGAFIIGLLMEVLALRLSMPQPSRFLLVTGFLGGFTTFSAFSLESALLMEKGDYLTMGAYIAASVIGTIIAVFIGSSAIKAFL